MNSLWNKNLAAFKNRFPSLFELIEPEINSITTEEKLFKEIGYELIPAKNGSITASQFNIRLHSAYNPEREALQAVTQENVLQKSTIVFYGFGLGYHIQQWASESLKHPSEIKWNKKIVIIEPDFKILAASFFTLDWSEIFKINQLILAINCPVESVLPLIEDTSKINIGNSGVSDAYYFSIPAFTSHAKDYFSAVQTLIKRNQTKNDINAATLKKFGKLWTSNSLKNIQLMKTLTPISVFQNADKKDLPFLILGAGPSLEKIIPYFAKIKQKVITVCVETALPVLLKNNCDPDFIILSDPQYWAYKHIAGLKAPESYLISEISTYPPVFRFPCKQILLCSSQFPVGQYFEQFTGVFGDLGTGGSVASSAWNFAYFCGARKIFVNGLDLSFPGKQTHIKGSQAEQTLHTFSNRISSVEKSTTQTLYSANAVLSTNYKNQSVLTDSRMKMFAWWFESRLAACPEVKTYTFSEDSLQIPGIELCNFEELLSLPDKISERNDFLELGNQKKKFSPETCNQFEKILKDFPQEDFLTKYPFLKDFL